MLGQDRYEARKNLVADLEKLGMIDKIEDYVVPLGHCQRCNTIVEPLISLQWFVKMMPLATPALAAVKYGQIKIVPERFEKVYTDWLENIHDWTISRQLWWGHRIPVWYCDTCGQMTVSREDPTNCAHCDSTIFTRKRMYWIPGLARGCGLLAHWVGRRRATIYCVTIPLRSWRRATTLSSSGWRVWLWPAFTLWALFPLKPSTCMAWSATQRARR